ncbi:MAG TPA: exodeoxyribonuclease V subunit gamma [Casimicrobiaceae bacterium]|nr:exodeoxyribonuclease V subunit gamma [Casimicrobiaceae bacterium]
MALHLTSSNRFERLLDSLLSGLARPGASPFAPDRVIVPSVAVRRRIELATADAFGICANVHFRFLAQWLWEQIGKVVPGVDETSPFAPARLSWRILRVLGEDAFTAQHAPLQRYLDGADELMRYELAQRIAMLYDQYITYRTDWLDAWSGKGRVLLAGDHPALQHQDWQAALWRRIAGELGTQRQHPSVAFFNTIRNGAIDARAAGLPEVAHVFCLPSIPPLYVQMLRELARWADLHVYVLNPCEAYWLEIVAPRRLAQVIARGQQDHHEVGNRLLARWGTQTKAHLQVMMNEWPELAQEDSDYEATAADTLLGRLQRSIVELTDLEPGALCDVRRDDRSIEVHVCHSLTRELEVLQDQLLAMFDADRTLAPADVVVVTPALEEAAPLVEAVFGNVTGARRIPFDITGRARTEQNAAARALRDLLSLAASRFHASDVFEVLQQPIVARRFGLDANALDAIRTWMRDAGIRWGLHAEHRAAFDVPALSRHSFADGLDRLFLGYALPDHAQHTLAGILPAGHVEGTEAVALGSFWRALQLLDSLREELARERPAAEWLRVLQRAIRSFFDPVDEELDDVRELENALALLHEDIRAGADTLPIGLDVVRRALGQTLDDPARGGVPGGGVTFASMISLRNLPYRVVCAIGLDDGAFPSLERPLEFDLIAAAPREGDRQRRAEDRNVFLDLVMAARERLYLSYTGRNIRDNSALPPSGVIADLLEVLVPALAEDARSLDAQGAAMARLVIEHPLQPFSADYFRRGGDPRIASFNQDYCDALKARAQRSVPVSLTSVARHFDDADEIAEDPEVPFFGKPLPEPGPEWRVVRLERLIQFFQNPARYLLKQRLGIALPEAEAELDDEEPFLPDWKASSALAKRVLPALLEGRDLAAVRVLARAGLEYPAGGYGEPLLDRELGSLAVFASQLRMHTSAPAGEPITRELVFEIDGHPWQLQGAMSDLRPSGLVRYRYDNVRPRDYLAGWIEHLFLNAIDAPVEKRTIWQSRDGAYRLGPIPDALERLQELLALYAEGLRAPLHFYPKSSWAYALEGRIAAAEQQWITLPILPYKREDQDPAYRLCLRGAADPLDARFEQCARIVFSPLLAAIDDPRLER